MSEIKFYIPKDETIPTDLRLYVDNVAVKYERIDGGFAFHVFFVEEEKALKIVNEVVSNQEKIIILQRINIVLNSLILIMLIIRMIFCI